MSDERTCRNCKYCADLGKAETGEDLILCCLFPKPVPRSTAVPCAIIDVREFLDMKSEQLLLRAFEIFQAGIERAFGEPLIPTETADEEEETH